MFKIKFSEKFKVIPHPVKNNDSVVEWISDDGQDGGDNGQVNLSVCEREETHCDQHIMGQG